MSLHEITKMEGGSTSSKAGGSPTNRICSSSEMVQLIREVSKGLNLCTIPQIIQLYSITWLY